MLTGQQALWRIEQATAAVRAQENECAAALTAADRELAGLRAARGELIRQLAGARLEALRREGIGVDLASAEVRALQITTESREALDRLNARIADAQATRTAAEAARHARAEEATRRLTALEAFQAGVEAKVRGSGEWIAAKEALDQAQRIFDAADRKAGAAEADRAVKGEPYERDPLFMYLWTRGFGTPTYRSGPFVRFFDGKVAQLIGFQTARANYAMLKEIPLRLRQHAEVRRAALDEARERLAGVEKAGLDAEGAQALTAEHEAARRALGEADDWLKAADDVLRKLDADRDRALAAAASGAEMAAVKLVADADSAASIAELYRKAAITMSSEDDQIVRRIEAGDRALAAAERARADLFSKARTLAGRRREIETERARFRQRGYDSPLGGFADENAVSDALGGFLKGAITGAVLGQVLQGGYHERERRADSGFGGGGGFNFPGGGGGWIGGGGSGGDGFRTGGGF